MLDFFRRYQRYFFLVITVVVIISFSFFGTYSTLGSNTWREQLAFKAVDGKEVTRSDVDEMAIFLATDNEDKQLYGGAWGPNFLNDGVIRKDFLETGLAQELVSAYRADVQDDLQKRLQKEKKYTPYMHPQAPFLSMENVWSYFIPDMTANFDTLRAAQDATDPGAFNSRIALFLGEKTFPSSSVKQVLRYQEKQYSWLKPDEDLNQRDLSLFGYHTLEDWFGPHFTRLVSQFIINAAILAEAQGYQVSKAEAMADLIRNTQTSYQQNQNKPSIGVASPEEYFTEQLRLLNMDQARAVKIWRQVLLFRRYFQDAGHSALVDTLAYQQFNQFSNESLFVDVYRLPAELRFGDYDTLQKFEVYLNAVSKQTRKDPLDLPTEFLSVAEVSRTYPELVQKRYVLDVAQVNDKKLQARIGIKDMWNWEIDEQNWATLKKQFPELNQKAGKTREERFETLDGLDSATRSKIDAFAKKAILRSHPEWIAQALADAQPQKMAVGLRTEGGKMPFNGLDAKDKRQAFIRLLDQASLNEGPAEGSPLYAYTADDQNYYRIRVLERSPDSEILTFAEANADGTLNDVRQRALEKYYVAIREQDPAAYQKENKEWKSFNSVKELVAEHYLNKTLAALQTVQKTLFVGDKEPSSWSKDQAASFRFYAHLQKAKEALQKKPEEASQFVRASEGEDKEQPSSRRPLKDQWLLEKATTSISRQKQEAGIDPAVAFAMVENTWSAIETPVNGNILFFQLKGKSDESSKQATAMAEQARQAQALLSAEAQRQLMRHVLQEIQAKGAISLAYLKIPQDSPANEPESLSSGF
ncbi:SurA N-terminal domain-containing protein [Candidatus Protochlamydia phocaeensis]|uniref:SurA N-terminal domain-containing protein n=1 Tax=Candidatus Protochlamydia phocaeensis TaxID=1414722 RepID=UPI00083982F3|nr:SurA N-terminal domain-containing protein [Candidatus Protochlamydia phocaeensis]